jgi:hypothetical protein
LHAARSTLQCNADALKMLLLHAVRRLLHCGRHACR